MANRVAGDKILAYPNLANIPTYAWQGTSARVKGRLFGVPQERPLPATALFIDRGAFGSVGAQDDGWTKDDFATAVKALSRNKQFGLGANKASPFAWRERSPTSPTKGSASNSCVKARKNFPRPFVPAPMASL